MSPWRQKWQCGWFENWTENNLPSSETLVRSDGIHKSRITEPQTELNEQAHKSLITHKQGHTHTNVWTVFWACSQSKNNIFSMKEDQVTIWDKRESQVRWEEMQGRWTIEAKVRSAADVRKNASQDRKINIHAVSDETEIILSSQQGDILLASHIWDATSYKT